MPSKKIKLSELLLEIDKDHLCDILLNLAESSNEIDNRVRNLITPKNQLNNPISYYKKLIGKLPNRINNASDRKLLLEGLKPVLTQIKDLQNIRNYAEATKPLFVILEILLLKLSKSHMKGMMTEMQKAAISWCDNVDKIPNSEIQFNSLHELLGLENAKEFKIEPILLGYRATHEEVVPVYSDTNGLHRDFYQMLLQLSKSIESTTLLEDLRKHLMSHTNSKYFNLQLLYISQKIDPEVEFVSKVKKDLKDREGMVLLKEFFWKKGEYTKAVDILFQHIELNKDNFNYKSSDEYLSALDYIGIYEKNPEYFKLKNYCQVLVYLISTGENYTAQDCSSKAKWRIFLVNLITVSKTKFNIYYEQIISILRNKKLYKTLAYIGLEHKDKKILAEYLGYLDYLEDIIESCEIIAKNFPDVAFKKFSNIIRTQLVEYDYGFFDFDNDFRKVFKKERILALLEMFQKVTGPENSKKIINMIAKVNRCYKAGI
jgi:hypothetical protein